MKQKNYEIMNVKIKNMANENKIRIKNKDICTEIENKYLPTKQKSYRCIIQK